MMDSRHHVTVTLFFTLASCVVGTLAVNATLGMPKCDGICEMQKCTGVCDGSTCREKIDANQRVGGTCDLAITMTKLTCSSCDQRSACNCKTPDNQCAIGTPVCDKGCEAHGSETSCMMPPGGPQCSKGPNGNFCCLNCEKWKLYIKPAIPQCSLEAFKAGLCFSMKCVTCPSNLNQSVIPPGNSICEKPNLGYGLLCSPGGGPCCSEGGENCNLLAI